MAVGSIANSAPTLGKDAYEVGFLVGTKHKVNSIHRTDVLGLQLGVTSRHYDKSTGVGAYHAMNGLTALVVGNLCNRTGVDQAKVGRLAFGRFAHSHLLQKTRKSRRL